MIFKVAVLQKRAEKRAVSRNVSTVLFAMEEAAGQGAGLLLLPECFLTGYDLTIPKEEGLSEEDPAFLREGQRRT